MKCATLWPDPIFVQIPLHCRCTCLRVEEIKTNNKDFKRWNLRKRSRCWSRRWGNKIAPSRCSSPGDKSCRLLWKVAKYLSNYYTYQLSEGTFSDLNCSNLSGAHPGGKQHSPLVGLPHQACPSSLPVLPLCCNSWKKHPINHCGSLVSGHQKICD